MYTAAEWLSSVGKNIQSGKGQQLFHSRKTCEKYGCTSFKTTLTTQSYLEGTHTAVPLKTSKSECATHAVLHIHTSPSSAGESKDCR
jgi:hypothetical protein